MKISKYKGFTAVLAAGALVLAACGGGDTGTTTDDTSTDDTSTAEDETDDSAAGASTGIILANSTEPQNALFPAKTNEVGGGKILDLIHAGLVSYDAEGNTENEIAESFESDDNITWTVNLREGVTFTDGTEVKAHNFVDAWKLHTYDLNNYFYSYIEGFDEEAQTELTGLEVVDDYSFTVTLTEPQADFPLRMGYSAYYPLPDAAFEDEDAYAEHPFGAGPYMLESADAWQHNVQIELVPNPDYDGPRQPQNGGVTLVFYPTQDAAYTDLLGGTLDVLDAIPESALSTYESELDGRSVSQGAAVFQSFTIHKDEPGFGEDEEGQLRRKALSMAIDREEITEVIFQGTRTPAVDFTSPVVAGFSDGLEGAEVLEFNPEEAKKLWDEADAIAPYEGTFTIAYNTDGGHQAWVDAVANQLSNNLGILAEGKPYAAFSELRDDVTNRTMQGAFRTGWQADYPSMSNFLGPLYGTGAGSNDGDYSNPEFDSLIAEANTLIVDDPDQANALMRQAQEILLQDLPAFPLWYASVTGGWSENVDNVVFGWNSVPVYHEITKEG